MISCKITEIKVLYDDEKNIIMHNRAIFSQNTNNLLVENQTFEEYTFNIIMIVFLTLFAGAMSGLTVGYLSIDDLVLELKSKTGTEVEKEHAEKVLPIISKRHWLLVTLLLCNASAMEALPIFLNRIVDEYAAIAISVSLVLVFGEVLPQAVCTGPSQIKIASFLGPMTLGLMYVTYPLSYPIALFLDWLLGKHSKSRFVNTELKSLIELHTLEALNNMNVLKNEEHQGLHDEQANLMISAIEIKSRTAIEMMIPIRDVFMIDYNEPIDRFKLNLILDKGYSRIPVYSDNRNDILGILRIKQLIGLDLTQSLSLRRLGLKLKAPLVIDPKTNAMDMLREFRKGKSHMAFITEQVEDFKKKLAQGGVSESLEESFLKRDNTKIGKIVILGIVTLEDVLEEMINIDILDEDDYAKTKTKKSTVKTQIISKYILT